MKQDRLIYKEPTLEMIVLSENDVATDIVQASGEGNDNNIGGANYNDFFG